MATTGENDKLALVAGQDLTACQYKVVGVAGTIVADNSSAFGLVWNKPKINEPLSVMYDGIGKLWAGSGGVTAGNRIKVVASGWVIPCNSGDGAIGKAIASANSGSLFEAMVDFTNAATTY